MELIKFDGIKMSSLFVSCRCVCPYTAESHVVIYLFILSFGTGTLALLSAVDVVLIIDKVSECCTIRLSKFNRNRCVCVCVCVEHQQMRENEVNECEKSCYKKFSIEFRSCTNFMLAHIKHNWIWIACLEWQWVSHSYWVHECLRGREIKRKLYYLLCTFGERMTQVEGKKLFRHLLSTLVTIFSLSNCNNF